MAEAAGRPLKRRILVVLPDHPYPATMGSRVRNLAVVEALASWFDLQIVTLVHDRSQIREPGPIPSLGRWIAVPAPHRRTLAHRLAGQIDYRLRGREWERESWFLGSRAVAGAVDACLARFQPDLVHVAYWYTLRRLGRRPRPPLWVLDTHDVQFERWERIRGRPNAREKSAEIAELRRHDLVVAVTERDAGIFRKEIGGTPRVETIPMGVDLERWGRRDLTAREDASRIAYYGNMASEINRRAALHLCREILPELRRARPELEVWIIGADPPAEIRSLARLPGVRVTGTVEDPRAWLTQCDLFALCTRRASGIRSRAAEVMALRIPVVAYPEALEGMPFEAGRDYVAAATPIEFAGRILSLLQDRATRERIARSAADQVEAHYGSAATYGRFPSLYAELLDRRGG